MELELAWIEHYAFLLASLQELFETCIMTSSCCNGSVSYSCNDGIIDYTLHSLQPIQGFVDLSLADFAGGSARMYHSLRQQWLFASWQTEWSVGPLACHLISAVQAGSSAISCHQARGPFGIRRTASLLALRACGLYDA